MAAVVGTRQHAAGHVGQQVLAHRPAGAEADGMRPGITARTGDHADAA